MSKKFEWEGALGLEMVLRTKRMLDHVTEGWGLGHLHLEEVMSSQGAIHQVRQKHERGYSVKQLEDIWELWTHSYRIGKDRREVYVSGNIR